VFLIIRKENTMKQPLSICFGVAAGCLTMAGLSIGYEAISPDFNGLAVISLVYAGLAISAGVGFLAGNAIKNKLSM
jgi:hypothetical protein